VSPPFDACSSQGRSSDLTVLKTPKRFFRCHSPAGASDIAEAHVAKNIVGSIEEVAPAVRHDRLPLTAKEGGPIPSRPPRRRGDNRLDFRAHGPRCWTGLCRGHNGGTNKQIDRRVGSDQIQHVCAIHTPVYENACRHAHGGRGQNFMKKWNNLHRFRPTQMMEYMLVAVAFHPVALGTLPSGAADEASRLAAPSNGGPV